MPHKSKGKKKVHGYLSLVLHAHLPYVRHPECNYVMEENWLFEAITETYIPLLVIFENLIDDGIPFRITMSMTPPLCTMLTDPLLQDRYVRHITKLIELTEKELHRTADQPEFYHTAKMYNERFKMCKNVFVDINDCNLVSAFSKLQEKGVLEIITCGATHGYLPNMQSNPKAVKAQIMVAAESYQSFFGRPPKGIWLPECGYYPGVEKYLQDAGIKYFFTDTHGVLHAKPRPTYGVFAPIICGTSSVAAFGRDTESSKSVWSSKIGYPGDVDYREFYRDIGYDLDMEYIAPYIDPVGIRINTGIKYYRITGKHGEKQPYVNEWALKKANSHAGNFLFNREKQIEYLSSIMDRTPIIVAPYDAELFGHWWYEGPDWLNFLIRKTALEQSTVKLIAPSDYLRLHPENQVCTPSFSSWGSGGYSRVWLDGTNDWIYRHLHRMEGRMSEYAQTYYHATGIQERALKQMARELLLAESSDWAFIMKTGTMVQYAVRRTKEHIANFMRLYEEIGRDSIDTDFLTVLESHNNIFPHIDFRVYV